MAGATKPLLMFAVLVMFCVLTEATYSKCDPDVIKCIKRVNKNYYLGGLAAAEKLIANKHYLITYYSAHLIKENNLTCISTEFTPTGNKDCYHNSCTEKQPEIPFKTGYNFVWGYSIIKDYQKLNLSAHCLYSGTCFVLYVCCQKGVVGPHITVYCPLKEKNSATVKAETRKAIALFKECGIDDGAYLCQDECYWF